MGPETSRVGCVQARVAASNGTNRQRRSGTRGLLDADRCGTTSRVEAKRKKPSGPAPSRLVHWAGVGENSSDRQELLQSVRGGRGDVLRLVGGALGVLEREALADLAALLVDQDGDGRFL